jgi:hypothetical protein
MNPNISELDQPLTIGQVEPPPEPVPNDPEEPTGEVTDNEDPA